MAIPHADSRGMKPPGDDDEIDARWREAGKALSKVAPDVLESLLEAAEAAVVGIPRRRRIIGDTYH